MKSFRTTLFLSVLVFAFEGGAAGKRYLVTLKDNAGIQVAQRMPQFQIRAAALSQWAANINSVELPSASVFMKLKGSLSTAEQLKHVNAMIVQSSDAAEIQNIKNDPNVIGVEEEVIYPLPASAKVASAAAGIGEEPPPHIVGINDFKSTSATPWGIGNVAAEDAWTDSSAGLGARVMILDTGIDRTHPSLTLNFEKGKNLLDDNIQPYDYFDKVGHGTHVSGTIAGLPDDSGFTGVAPAAKILMGRVCSEAGCSSIGIVKGLEWAIAEHVDVVSMSLGGTASSLGERVAMAHVHDAGIVVVAASGNESEAQISYPAALPQAIAVGAIDDKDVRAPFSNYGAGLAIVAPGVSVRSSVPQGTGRVSKSTYSVGDAAAQAVDAIAAQNSGDPLVATDGTAVYAGLGAPEDFAKVDMKGKIALLLRGTLTFSDKVKNAIAAGAIGVVIQNNVAGPIHASLSDPVSIPVVTIEQALGQSLQDALTAKQVVGFHLQMAATNYATMDGTSMATPHVAGVVALIKAANKALTPDQVRAILTKTAKPLGPNDKNEYGAGAVNAAAAVREAIALAPLKLPLASAQ